MGYIVIGITQVYGWQEGFSGSYKEGRQGIGI